MSYGYPGGLNLDVVDPETGEAIPDSRDSNEPQEED